MTGEIQTTSFEPSPIFHPKFAKTQNLAEFDTGVRLSPGGELMDIMFSVSADDLRADNLLDKRDYYRELVVPQLEKRLAHLKERGSRVSAPWVHEERQRVESEI